MKEKSDTEIRSWHGIHGILKDAFQKLNLILRKRKISLDIKKNVQNSYVISMFLYEREF